MSRASCVVALLSLAACGCAGRGDKRAETSQAETGQFTKNGDNGTVSCNDFCSGAQWGPTGMCVSGSAPSVPCAVAPGDLEGAQLTCTCVDPTTGEQFEKDGDNGTASCDTFCAGAAWGRTGTCVSASAATVPCDLATGDLKGAQLSCTCTESTGGSGGGSGDCQPATCDRFVGTCGEFPDGCGNTIHCTCGAPEICVNYSSNKDIGGYCCLPNTCPGDGSECSLMDDGCGGYVWCYDAPGCCNQGNDGENCGNCNNSADCWNAGCAWDQQTVGICVFE